MKFKSTLLTGFLTLIMLLVMSIPVLANTSNWSFTMDFRVVDGDGNGVYHEMDAGSMTISGSIWVYSTDQGHNQSTNTVTIEVWKKNTLWFDDLVGSVSVTPRTDGVSSSFSKNLGSVNSGTYYIFAWKTEDDGFNLKASGKLETK